MEAWTLYGPGHQLLSYQFMEHFDFSVRGFRLAHLLINGIAVFLMFSTFMLALGLRTGITAIVCALFVSPLLLTDFFGWGVLFRWFGPLLVGAVLPALLWVERDPAMRLTAAGLLGCSAGALAWFASENLLTSGITAALILVAAVARRRTTWSTVVGLGLVFLVSTLTTWLLLILALVGVEHLHGAVSMFFRGGSLVASGLSNTPWTDYGGQWGIAYYFTPYLVVIAFALAFNARLQSTIALEIRVGQIVGVGAAAASLVPITLLRADYYHFLGPSIALAPLMALCVLHLPELLSRRVLHREMIRAGILLVVFIVYFLPHMLPGSLGPANPLKHLSQTWLSLRGIEVARQIMTTKDTTPALGETRAVSRPSGVRT